MKVVHISTYDRKGGAAIGAYRLHKAFLKFGIDSVMLVKEVSVKEDKSIIKADPPKQGLWTKMQGIVGMLIDMLKVEKKSSRLGVYSEFRGRYRLAANKNVQEADVIYLHWVNNNYIDIIEVENLLRLGKPVFWLLHDVFPLTGGCHYPMECTKFHENCFGCDYWLGGTKAQSYLQKKKRLLKYKNLRFVATTNWLVQMEKESALKEIPVSLIPYSLDINKFHPIEKENARKLFHISDSKKVILFGAQGAIYNYYKGFKYFQEALEELLRMPVHKDEILVLVFGSDYNREIADMIGFETYFLGALQDEYSLIMAYNSADVFVIPSLAEAFGQVIIESMACNTPVVGFDVGGIPDNVNENTGYLAKYCDSGNLAQGIYQVLYCSGTFHLCDFVKERYAEDVIVNKHREMWEKYEL